MSVRTIKVIELAALVLLAVVMIVAACIALKSGAPGEVTGMFITGVFTCLPLVVQAIRNIPAGEAMNRMVDHLAASRPVPPPPENTGHEPPAAL